MDWMGRMNNALDYIESHLTEDMDYEKIARAAYCSAYHFPRMFISVTGITLSDYIRRRRLTRAAYDLEHEKASVIDVAVKYGYDSADAFSRAFFRQHHVHPSRVREGGVQLTSYPKLSFYLSIKGDVPMNYRLEDLDFALRIVGRAFPVNTEHAFEIAPGIWHKEMEGGFIPKLIDMSWENPKCKLESLLGVIGTKPRIHDEIFDYFIGVRYDGPVPDDMEVIELPPCTWAVFPDVYGTWKRLYTEWLPSSGYDLVDLPIVECHYPPDHDPSTELWVPVVPHEEE